MRSVLPLLVFLTILGVSLGHGSAQQNDEGQRSKQTARLREAADQAERQAKLSWRLGVHGTITDHGICLDWDLDKYGRNRWIVNLKDTKLIYLDGKEAKLSDLKSGTRVSIEAETSPLLVLPPPLWAWVIVIHR